MQSAKKQMTFIRPRNELFLGEDTCLTLGASHNMSPLNNRCIVVNCRKRFNKQQKAIAVLDRCGNNWKNGKGGCGILMHEEYAPCCATMFQPFVFIQKETEKKNAL